MKFKRIAYKVEPTLKVHRHIVTVSGSGKGGAWNTKYHYCTNLKEVKAAKETANEGDIVEVYTADHNFRNAWERIK